MAYYRGQLQESAHWLMELAELWECVGPNGTDNVDSRANKAGRIDGWAGWVRGNDGWAGKATEIDVFADEAEGTDGWADSWRIQRSRL